MMETARWVHHLVERISLPTATVILGCSVVMVLGLLLYILIYKRKSSSVKVEVADGLQLSTLSKERRKSSSSSSSSSVMVEVADGDVPVTVDEYENYNTTTTTNIIIPEPMSVGSSRCGSGISIISCGTGREILVKDFLIQSLRWSEPVRSTTSCRTDTSTVEDGGGRECCRWNRRWWWWWRCRGKEKDSMMMKLMSRGCDQGCDICERCWPGRRGSKCPVWQRPILMGEKCELPRFSGLILYDERGQPLQDRTSNQFTTANYHHHQVPSPRRGPSGVGGGNVAVTLEDLFTLTNSSDRWPTIQME